MKGKCYRYSFVLGILLMLTVLTAIPAQAAGAKLTALKPGKTYKTYDITGDGKKDTIKLSKQKKDTSMWMTLYEVKITVNKKITYTASSVKKVDLRIFHKGKNGVLISNEVYATSATEVEWLKIVDGRMTNERLNSPYYGGYYKASSSKLIVTGYDNTGNTEGKLVYKLGKSTLIK